MSAAKDRPRPFWTPTLYLGGTGGSRWTVEPYPEAHRSTTTKAPS